MALLNKGLKYSLHHKDKHWLSNLALEAEAALTPLPPPEQEHIRHQIVHNLRKLYKHHNNTPSPKTPRNEIKIVNQIKKKTFRRQSHGHWSWQRQLYGDNIWEWLLHQSSRLHLQQQLRTSTAWRLQ